MLPFLRMSQINPKSNLARSSSSTWTRCATGNTSYPEACARTHVTSIAFSRNWVKSHAAVPLTSPMRSWRRSQRRKMWRSHFAQHPRTPDSLVSRPTRVWVTPRESHGCLWQEQSTHSVCYFIYTGNWKHYWQNLTVIHDSVYFILYYILHYIIFIILYYILRSQITK